MLEPHGQELMLTVHHQATIQKEEPEEKSAIADPQLFGISELKEGLNPTC